MESCTGLAKHQTESLIPMIDLHTHSRASDGTDTPAELAVKAVSAGVSVVALTDHDTVSGVAEFLSAAEKLPLTAVPGIELSSMLYTKEVHITGLLIDHTEPHLLAAAEQLRVWRTERNLQIVEKLRQKGYDITCEELLAEAGGESIGRPHIASLLVRKGYFQDIQEVFRRLIGRGMSCYLAKKFLPPDECIRLIHGAGGLAFWAHPLHAQHGAKSLLRKLGCRLLNEGLDGLEAYYPSFSEEQTAETLAFCTKYQLLVSGGSDYHGMIHANTELGIGTGTLNIPESLYETIHQTWLKRHEKTL